MHAQNWLCFAAICIPYSCDVAPIVSTPSLPPSLPPRHYQNCFVERGFFLFAEKLHFCSRFVVVHAPAALKKHFFDWDFFVQRVWKGRN